MRDSKTALCHPTMLAKIRLAMRLAFEGKGELMNGHGHRCYVPNRHGRNVLRLSWVPETKEFVIYGDCSRLVTANVKAAFERARACA